MLTMRDMLGEIFNRRQDGYGNRRRATGPRPHMSGDGSATAGSPWIHGPFSIVGGLCRHAAHVVGRGARWGGETIGRNAWVAERVSFFRAWRANPQGVGAIVPSSARLARAMTRHISPTTGSVIELGAGTGVFTRALLDRGLHEADLALVEMDPDFAHRLKQRFPEAEVHVLDASRLARRTLLSGEPAGAAICGVPLLNLPLKARIALVRGTFVHLRQGGALYFFTYGLHCPIPRRMLDSLGVRATKVDVVLANVPPAHVWRLTRRGRRLRGDDQG